MTFIAAQISDLHVSERGKDADGNYQTCDHLARAVAHIMAMDPRPDVVLATGDLVDWAKPEEYAVLKELFAPLDMPLYLIPGNHDSREYLRAAFPEHGYLPDAGFINYTVEKYPLRLIGLDTQIEGEIGGTMCAERLGWLDETLSSEPERPTLIFMHHPPITSGIEIMDRHGFENPAPMMEVVRRHPQVERVIAGHLHRPITISWAGTSVSVAPSTAHQIGLEMGDDAPLVLVMEPPAVYLHTWNEATGLVTHTSYVGAFEERLRKEKLGGKPDD